MSPWSRSTAVAVLAAVLLVAGASGCESDSSTGPDGKGTASGSATEPDDQGALPSTPVDTNPIPPPPPPDTVPRDFPVPRLERLPSQTITIPYAPDALVSYRNALWVKSHRGVPLFKVDPTTGEVLDEIDVGQLGCGDLVGGAGSVWVTGCGDVPNLVEVDELTGTVATTSERMGLGPTIRSGELWIGDQGEDGDVGLWRGPVDDLDQGRFVSVPGLNFPVGVVAVGDSIWTNDESSAVVYRIDPDSDQVRSAIPMPMPPSTSYLIEHDRAPWYLDIAAGDLIRVDPHIEKLRQLKVRFDYPTQSRGIAASTAPGAPGRLWVRSGDDEVWLVDTRADRVLRRIKVLDGGGGDVQQVGAILWVASFGTSELQRIPLNGAAG